MNRIIATYGISDRFMRQRTLAGGVHEILFLIPPGFLGDSEIEIPAGHAPRIRQVRERRCAETVYREYGAFSRRLARLGHGVEPIYVTSAVNIVCERVDQKRSRLQSLLVGLRFGPIPEYRRVERGLEERVMSFYEELVSGCLSTIARKFKADFTTPEKEAEVFLQKVDAGYRIYLYIPAKQVNEILARARITYAHKTGHAGSLRRVEQDGKSYYVLWDSEIERDIYFGVFRDVIRDRLEASTNDILWEGRQALPYFIPYPRLFVYPHHADPAAKHLAGIGVGILFVYGQFKTPRDHFAEVTIETRDWAQRRALHSRSAARVVTG